MSSTDYIEKFQQLTESEDYAFLREKGIEHIQKLAHDIWTDYNVHDPGITTLEMLCYAITDLGYRTGYPIQDILAEQTVGGNPDLKNFFTARQILTNNPVTINDFRKIIIDVLGVKNAWLAPVETPEPQMHIDCQHSQLTLDYDAEFKPVRIQGLYDVSLELESDPELGDLNVTYFTRKIDAGAKPFQIEVIFSSCTWQVYFDNRLDPVQAKYKLTEQVLVQLGHAGLPEPILILLEDLKNHTYETDDNFENALRQTIGESDTATYKSLIFLKSLRPIKDINFSEITSISQTQKYKGKLQVHLESGGQIDYSIVVLSSGIKTEENRVAIQDELNRTDRAGLLALYRNIIEKAYNIATDVFNKIHSHRCLCEDFYRFKPVEIEEIAVCADVEVKTDADLDSVLANIYYQIDHFLAPTIKFYTVAELQGRGKAVDEIFDGPILDHGFIDNDELEAAGFKNVIHVSDIIQIIMDVDGVMAVKNILLTNFYNGIPQTTGQEWCLPIGQGRATRLSINHSKIVFYKGLFPYAADINETGEKLKELIALDRYNRLGQDEYDLPIPPGQHRDILTYYSIQNDYPLTYGIGAAGLPRSATPLRKAQAKQLKAYLLFYDQLLANYLAQLAHVKDLFTMNPAIKKTWFSQPLYHIPDVTNPDVPNVQNLIYDFVTSLDLVNHPDIDLDDVATYQTEWQAYIDALKINYLANINEIDPLIEDQKTYERRKNLFLDHLMARFAEQFTDYVLLMHSLDHKKAPAELIEDKLAFINDYPEISHDRGKAFNYKDTKIYDRDNVSGLQKRVSRLVGFQSFSCPFLTNSIEKAFEIYQEQDDDGIIEFRFRLRDTEGHILLSSSTRYYSLEDARTEILAVAKYCSKKEHYQLLETTTGRFYFNLVDDQNKVIARRIEYFSTEKERELAIAKVTAFLKQSADCKGFHLLEHLLLRPKTSDDTLFTVCQKETCNTCSGFIDPYSFRVTVVVPYWPERFLNMDFRRFFESTIRQEAPAHVHVKICWVDYEAMLDFEGKYLPWLKENAREKPDPILLTQYQNALMEALESLRSVYPPVTLHDCKDEGEKSPILLNHSILGSI